MKLLVHKFPDQDVFTTKGITIQIDRKNPKVEEVNVPKELVNDVFNNPEKFTVKDKKLFTKKEAELTEIIK
jgi:hypothetical protein